MSTDFWAGYISGAAGILIGNPLDLIKVRLQAGHQIPSISTSSYRSQFSGAGALIRGATAPIVGYGALNALLFVTYNRTSSFLNQGSSETQPGLWTTWISGAIGGLATWIVSTPTEVVKCRAQTVSTSSSASSSISPTTSFGITREILRSDGIRGLYVGGVVTALRDSIGYGFYFWSYELASRTVSSYSRGKEGDEARVPEAVKVLLCGGLAGVATWASVFPLDVIKTRVQTQVIMGLGENTRLISNGLPGDSGRNRRMGAVEIARIAYKNEGKAVFFRGLGVCSVRAFIVNAVQWAVYEWMMNELDHKR
jgi:solute carrier family 25 carnitine/acylcarnitine transporter 20/29